MALRLRSIRFKVLIVILAVVLSPMLAVLLSSVWDNMLTAGIEEDLKEAVGKVKKRHLEKGESSGLEDIAAGHAVWIRIVDLRGDILRESDHHLGSGLGRQWRHLLSWVLGPEEVPNLKQVDIHFGALRNRPELQKAAKFGAASGCGLSPSKKLKYCFRVKKLGNKLVYAMAKNQRTILALFDYRYQVLKLVLYNLVLGLLLAFWMSRTIVRPVEKLRGEVLARAAFAKPGAGLPETAQDEVGQLAKAFNELLARLEARSKANEAFLSDLAHEFKNPLAAIRASAENLSVGEALKGTANHRSPQIILDASVRLDGLVSEFLELARAEAGLVDDERQDLDLVLLLSNQVDRFAADPRFADRQVSFESQVPSLELPGVARRLEMAMANLLDNGLSYAGASGTLKVALRRAEGRVEITFADDGPGIAEQDIDRVFERFFTTRREKHGTGLGLAICRAVIEAHDGQITVTSKTAQGAVFLVWLPLS